MFNLFRPKPEKFVRIDSAKFSELKKKKDHLLLDVRTSQEIESDSIPGSINIDYLRTGFQNKVAKLDKSKSYLVYCLYGPRSIQACKKMSSMGFEKIYCLEDGIISWNNFNKKI